MTDQHPGSTAYRYAVYFAPSPGSLGWLAGSHWLGRCAAQLQPLPQPRIDGVPPQDLHRLTASPRRYGWHATLKPPFALSEDTDWLTLHQAVQAVARGFRPFTLPPLHVQRIHNFLALVPAPTAPQATLQAIDALAAACVMQLQPLATPLPDAELAQRRAAGLTPRQDELLQRWGHPLVLDEFRFHMSITGNLAEVGHHTQTLVQQAAEEFFADLPTLRFDSLALFAEPTPGADFVLLDHLELG